MSNETERVGEATPKTHAPTAVEPREALARLVQLQKQARHATNPLDRPDTLTLDRAWADAEAALAQAPPAPAEPTALQRFNEIAADPMCEGELDKETPLERLRFFCSLAMKGQDWLDVEPFFDALAAPAEPEPMTREFCAAYPGTAAGIINTLAKKIDALEAAPAEQPSVEEVRRLADALRSESHGWVEWRVQHPVSKAYCMTYSRSGGDAVLDPEHEANEWLRKHRKEFPDGRFVDYEVARVEVQSKSDRLMREAAAMLDALAKKAPAPQGGPVAVEALRELVEADDMYQRHASVLTAVRLNEARANARAALAAKE